MVRVDTPPESNRLCPLTQKGHPFEGCFLLLVPIAWFGESSLGGRSAAGLWEAGLALVWAAPGLCGWGSAEPGQQPCRSTTVSAELAFRAGGAVGDRFRWVVVGQVDPPPFEASDPFPSALNAHQFPNEGIYGLCHAVLPWGLWEEETGAADPSRRLITSCKREIYGTNGGVFRIVRDFRDPPPARSRRDTPRKVDGIRTKGGRRAVSSARR